MLECLIQRTHLLIDTPCCKHVLKDHFWNLRLLLKYIAVVSERPHKMRKTRVVIEPHYLGVKMDAHKATHGKFVVRKFGTK